MRTLLVLLILASPAVAQRFYIGDTAPTTTSVSTQDATRPWYWLDTAVGVFKVCTANPCTWAAITPEASHAHNASNIDAGVLNIARIPTGQTGTTVPLGNDARFTDARTPLAHAHNASFACGTTDKVRAFDVNGVPVCAADQTSAGGGATLLRIATADYTNSTTGFTDVTGLTLAVNAGTHNINCDLIVSAAATTTGIQVVLNGPANSFLHYHSEYFTSATAKANFSSTTYDPTTAANGTYPVASGGTAITAYKLNGQVVATGSGTIAVRAKSEVNASAITIYRGSSCSVF